MPYPLGVVAVTFGAAPLVESAQRAAALGFDHIDIGDRGRAPDDALPAMALPVGDRICSSGFRRGETSMAPPLRSRDSFDEAVATLRLHPGARVETVPGSVAGSVERARALVEAVPGLRLTVDTGHVATWGEDPIDLLGWAAHVQLRQAAHGRPQLHPDEDGDVDFDAVVRALRRVGYEGLLSVEYFDLPSYGWPLADPVGHAVALARCVRPLLVS